jgi:AAA15 family ATPase/GTPase
LIEKSPELKSLILRIVRDADVGIHDVEISEIPIIKPTVPDIPFLPEHPLELDDPVEKIGLEKVPDFLPKETANKVKGVLDLMNKAVVATNAVSSATNKLLAATEGLASIANDYWKSIREFTSQDVNHPLVTTTHRLNDSEESVTFLMDRDESNGTRRFFGLLGLVLQALDRGDLLVFDELECSLHPMLTRKLIELFQDESVNSKGAQLVFATHDITLMDKNLFRRDQIWLTEKNDRGATELFSLYDFDPAKRPRISEVLAKNYLAGRYGGVPKFGPTFEDLEIK